ncbi:MAG: hypothetical protein ACYCXF_05245 [Thermoleophilia bacterium]
MYLTDSTGNSILDNKLQGNTKQAEDAFGTASVFSGNVDAMARTTAPGCDRPDLTLSKTTTFWSSNADYVAHTLSVTYVVHNNSGSQTAYDFRFTGSSGDQGVGASLTTMPIAKGDIAPGGNVSTTLVYSVPAGVGGFMSSTTGSARNACGALFLYP